MQTGMVINTYRYNIIVFMGSCILISSNKSEMAPFTLEYSTITVVGMSVPLSFGC